eukprot:m.44806 g.44806  ORF g.44806 m.44806 type:complete len:349 (+) comp13049_c0_seq7:62-1108(+)
MNATILCALLAIATSVTADDCTVGHTNGKALASCTLNDGSTREFDLTAAFMNNSKPYLQSLIVDQAYLFYVTAIVPGMSNADHLPMCKFEDGFTDSNSGAQADNKPQGGTCWSSGDIYAETWTYDESSQTMTIESKEGQDDRKTRLIVVCSKDTKPVITFLSEVPPKEYNFQIKHSSACLGPPPTPGWPCIPNTSRPGTAAASCKGDSGTVEFDLTEAFTDCDGSPFLTTFSPDASYAYLLSAIWPGIPPKNTTRCTSSTKTSSVFQVENKPKGACKEVADMYGLTWSYDHTNQAMTIASSGSDCVAMTVYCSPDSVARVAPGTATGCNTAFQVYHRSACLQNTRYFK